MTLFQSITVVVLLHVALAIVLYMAFLNEEDDQ